MSNKKKPTGNPVDTINRNSTFVQMSFDLKKQDQFATSFAVEFTHFKAMPSPIGQKDRGDYRRSDGVDTITSNGMIYRCAGKFSATMTDNSREQRRSEGGFVDPSQGRIVMPRFYNTEENLADGKRIYIAPGDRLYVADPDTDVKVSNYQKMDYEQGVDNVPMYPISELEETIIDSRNIEYIYSVDFCITQDGNVRWMPGGKNPGIDPDTGRGRIYSIRYLYRAYWYIMTIPKEVRITNVTTGLTRNAERMAYHAVIVREFVFHNQNRGDEQNLLKPKNPKRVVAAPIEPQNPGKFSIPVDMSAIGEDSDE